jgi:TRAP-type C4-dicarboxylate transport system substrate-binding protein
MKLNLSKKSLALLVGLSFGCFAAQADTLRIASGVPPKHPAHNPLYTEFQPLLPKISEGRLDAVLLGPEVVRLPGMRDGIKSGLVDIGLFLPAYFPADLPEVNLVGDMAFLGSNSQAMSGAMTEYVVTCGECQAELKKLGVVYASSHATNTYTILSKTPISSAADMKGKRLRTGGPQFSRWVEALGGTPVSTPVGETFEALSQGIIDGTVASTADIVSFRLNEVVSNITDMSLGTYHSTISHAIRNDKWASMSPEDRKALVLTSSRTSALSTQRWEEIAQMGRDIAAKENLATVAADQTLLDATAAFTEKDVAAAGAGAKERNGIENADAKLERFKGLIAKWEKIAEDNGNDPEKMGEAMETEIWSKVDFTTYGL